MGYNKENFKRIRNEYETKALNAQSEADARRRELYLNIPTLQALDSRLGSFGLRIMESAISGKQSDVTIADLRAENERILAERAELLRAHGYPADYTEPQYECPKCCDSGYVGIKMCSCMRRRLIEAGMQSSGLSALMERQSFENFSLDYYNQDAVTRKRMEQVFNGIQNYAKSFTTDENHPSGSLLFLGGTGLGKTHLSTAVARVVIERGYDVYYNSAVGMISDFEFRRFGNSLAASEGDNTERYTECDLLIIDDLGTEVVNQFTLSCLYHVLNTRLNLRKPTIISTNLTSADLKKTYTDRIYSRLSGEYQPMPFYGTDIRQQKIGSK
jgi:DNA replication protein DnaC